MADLTNTEAAIYVQRRLQRMGVERALARAGVRPGDTVRIGGIEMEYLPDAMATAETEPRRRRSRGPR